MRIRLLLYYLFCFIVALNCFCKFFPSVCRQDTQTVTFNFLFILCSRYATTWWHTIKWHTFSTVANLVDLAFGWHFFKMNTFLEVKCVKSDEKNSERERKKKICFIKYDVFLRSFWRIAQGVFNTLFYHWKFALNSFAAKLKSQHVKYEESEVKKSPISSTFQITIH